MITGSTTVPFMTYIIPGYLFYLIFYKRLSIKTYHVAGGIIFLIIGIIAILMNTTISFYDMAKK